MRDRKSDTAHRKGLPKGSKLLRHHRDGDKENNQPHNLEDMTRGAHTTLHNKTRQLGKLRKALTMHKRGEKLY